MPCVRSASIVLSASLLACAARGDVSFRTLAMTGDAAAGIGAPFNDFGAAYMGHDGRVAFVGSTNTFINQTGIWATNPNDPQSLELIAREGDAIADGPAGFHLGAFSVGYGYPRPKDNGVIGFTAAVTGPGVGADARGAFRAFGGELESVLIPGDVVPQFGPGVVIASVSDRMTQNRHGDMAMPVELTGLGVHIWNDTGIMAEGMTGLQAIKREGDAVPGLAGTLFDGAFESSPVHINDDGQVSMATKFTGAYAADFSVWMGYPWAVSMLSNGNQLSPLGLPWADSAFPHHPVSISNDGVTFLQSVIEDGTYLEAIWQWNEFGPRLIAREGDWGPIGRYGEMSAYGGTTSATGDVVFFSHFSGFSITSDNNEALVRVRPDGVSEIIIREGDVAPDVPLDATIGRIMPTDYGLDDHGRVYFEARMEGPDIDIRNNRALWVQDPDGTTQCIIRTDQYLVLPDGVGRWVGSFGIIEGFGTQSGNTGSFSSMGQVAIHVRFRDGERAIMIATLPPACPGDVNGDGEVNFLDLDQVLAHWGETGPVGSGGDTDLDGDTDFMDLETILAHWDSVCD